MIEKHCTRIGKKMQIALFDHNVSARRCEWSFTAGCTLERTNIYNNAT